MPLMLILADALTGRTLAKCVPTLWRYFGSKTHALLLRLLAPRDDSQCSVTFHLSNLSANFMLAHRAGDRKIGSTFAPSPSTIGFMASRASSRT